jgi:hypothetical protein
VSGENRKVTAKVFLTVEPEWALYGERVVGARVARLHQRRPLGLPNGGVVVEVAVQVPVSLFDPLRPPAIEVPADPHPSVTVAMRERRGDA